ncbi:tetratricopeptide repeat protein [Sorangium sp. So ce136]|uniref:tetratricopeptide repeat protein n=1 Tax=Sorangium sp. So ce136 TaxID=3133284 RepID=UPI003F04CD7D
MPHLARGRVDDAGRWARAALEAEPEHADALVLLGHVLLRRGDASGAREHAARALRTDVSAPDALRLLAAIKARESLLLGLWFQVSSVLAGLGPSAMLVLLAAYVAPGPAAALTAPPVAALRGGDVHRASCARVT